MKINTKLNPVSFAPKTNTFFCDVELKQAFVDHLKSLNILVHGGEVVCEAETKIVAFETQETITESTGNEAVQSFLETLKND
jgi:hypothetical protein